MELLRDDLCLRAPSSTFCRKLEDDAWIILDVDSPNWIVVNSVGKETVEAFNGKRTLHLTVMLKSIR